MKYRHLVFAASCAVTVSMTAFAGPAHAPAPAPAPAPAVSAKSAFPTDAQCVALGAPKTPFAFGPGESLDFDIDALGARAGKMTMRVLPKRAKLVPAPRSPPSMRATSASRGSPATTATLLAVRPSACASLLTR